MGVVRRRSEAKEVRKGKERNRKEVGISGDDRVQKETC